MIDRDLAADIDQLAAAIARLRPPQNSNPHAFHEDRSELASQARAIAQRCRSGPTAKAAAEPPAPVGRQSVSHATRHIEGRTVLVLTRRQAAADHPFY